MGDLRDYDVLFRIIATLITSMTMFVGLVMHLLCISFKESRGFVVGRYVSIPLSAALGWAYAGMEFSSIILIASMTSASGVTEKISSLLVLSN